MPTLRIDERQPIIVGVGQVKRADQSWPDIAGPLDLMHDAAVDALRDASVSGSTSLTDHIDHLTVVNTFAWDYANAPALLSERLGLADSIDRRYLPVGGNTPQRAVNELARQLHAGTIEMALMAGAEAVGGKRIARKAGEQVDWGTHPHPLPPTEERDPCHPLEAAQGLISPVVSYPIWEPALRVAAGRTPEEHSAHIGRLMARMTQVAATNPIAWFRQTATPEELMTVTPENRMISTPYPKRVNAIMAVDQGAALVLTTVGKARQLGISSDQWVFIIGGGDCYDQWYLTERTSYSHSPAMAKVAGQIWESSGLGLDDVAHLDLYSCFPSAVQLAMKAFGVSPDDPRPMTVTGGLPYHGGPGNNYTTHSIAAMTNVLRANPGDVGLCTGLGWYVTKHSAGLYASAPPTHGFCPVDTVADQAEIDGADHPVIETEPAGPAIIDGYSVQFDRDGSPERVRALARLDANRRTLVSNIEPEVARAMSIGEWHGATIATHPDTTFTL